VSLPELGIHGGPLRIGDLSGRVIGFDGIVSQSVQGKLLAKILKEILLSPTIVSGGMKVEENRRFEIPSSWAVRLKALLPSSSGSSSQPVLRV
jgi:hypothetical protein